MDSLSTGCNDKPIVLPEHGCREVTAGVDDGALLGGRPTTCPNGDGRLKDFTLPFQNVDRGPFTMSPAHELVTTAAWKKMRLTKKGDAREAPNLHRLGAHVLNIGLSRGTSRGTQIGFRPARSFDRPNVAMPLHNVAMLTGQRGCQCKRLSSVQLRQSPTPVAKGNESLLSASSPMHDVVPRKWSMERCKPFFASSKKMNMMVLTCRG